MGSHPSLGTLFAGHLGVSRTVYRLEKRVDGCCVSFSIGIDTGVSSTGRTCYWSYYIGSTQDPDVRHPAGPLWTSPTGTDMSSNGTDMC